MWFLGLTLETTDLCLFLNIETNHKTHTTTCPAPVEVFWNGTVQRYAEARKDPNVKTINSDYSSNYEGAFKLHC